MNKTSRGGNNDPSQEGKTKVVNGYTVQVSCSVEILQLAQKNAHKNDDLIVFDEEPHLYYIKGVCDYVSATTFIHGFFSEFEVVPQATRMVSRDDFKSEPRYEKYQAMRFDEKGNVSKH